MARKSVGRRTVKRREVNLFNFEDDFGNFDDSIVDDIEGHPRRRRKVKDNGDDFPDPSQTTRDLTGVAITLPLVGIGTSLISTL